jgi:hypothetical protein
MSSTGPRHTDETGDNAFGISIFAGVLLAMIGGFHILQGLSAVLKDDIFVKGADYTYAIDLTSWGWITMLLGAILVLVGELGRHRLRGALRLRPVRLPAVLPHLVDDHHRHGHPHHLGAGEADPPHLRSHARLP